MQFVFRTDASLEIGTGHVMRCLTLADSLRNRGAKSTFVCRPHAGNLLELIGRRGHAMIALKPAEESFTIIEGSQYGKWLGTDWASDAEQTHQALQGKFFDWLVVDHYAIDFRWEQILRQSKQRIFVIDDLADRPHECNLLLDQNLGRQAQDYDGLLGQQTQTLIGPKYALLRPEFSEWRKKSLLRRKKPVLKNLLITMGGVDKENSTSLVLRHLRNCDLPGDLRIVVVLGSTAPWAIQVKALAATMPCLTEVHEGVSNMAQLMAESDFCIGAAGSSILERCVLGLPALNLIQEANQYSGAMALQAIGAATIVNDLQQLFAQMSSIFIVDKQTAILKRMNQVAAQVTCGDGVSQVVKLLMARYV